MAETAGEWHILKPGYAATDDLKDTDKRTYAIYADSFGPHVHHIAVGLTKEDAELIVKAVNLYRRLGRVLDTL